MDLRDYQQRGLEELLAFFGAPRAADGPGREARVQFCTGSGKTVIATYVCAAGLHTHRLFAAPTNVIVGGFAAVDVDDWPRPHRADALDYFLTSNGGTVRTTHALLDGRLKAMRQLATAKPQFAAGMLLVGDEDHHMRASNVIGQIKRLWIAASGDYLGMTATPFDEDDGAPPGCLIRRTLPEQMAFGYAPRHITHQIVRVAGGGSSDDDDLWVAADPNQLARAIVEHMRRDAPSKAVVRIKNRGNRAAHTGLLAQLATAISATGRRVFVGASHADAEIIRRINAPVLHALGIGDGGTLNDVCEHERGVRHIDESVVDVIIGMQSVVEGFDWPLCSHVYNDGFPRKIVTAVQILGRATRPKLDPAGRPLYAGYPDAWANTAKLVLLTADDPRIEEAQSNSALHICAYLATFKQWSVLGEIWQLVRRLDLKMSDAQIESGVRPLLLDEHATTEIHRAWAEAKILFESQWERLPKHRGHYTSVDAARLTATYLAWRDRDKAIDYPRVKLAFLQSTPAYHHRLAGHIERAIRDGSDLPTAARDALRQLLAEFEADRTVTIADDIRDLDYRAIQLYASSVQAAATAAAAAGETVPPTPAVRATPSTAPLTPMDSYAHIRARGNP
jgi:hypothetical protein